MGRYTLDGERTRVTLHTGVQGLFSPLAHELELEARGWTGSAELEGPGWRIQLEAPLEQLRVVGVLKRGRVRDDVLAPADRAEIERRVRHELLAPLAAVRVEGEAGRIKVKGPSRTQELNPRFSRSDAPDGAITVDGQVALSLKALGIPEVKGPLGAFKVADGVEATFRAVFVPAAG